MQSRWNLLLLITIIPILLKAILIHEVVYAYGLYEGSAIRKAVNADTMISQQVQAIIPRSEQLVDGAIAVLSKGWRGMSPAEQEAFLILYDPAETGDVDEQFLRNVLSNYVEIRKSLGNEINVKYEPENDRCEGKRLYYTDIISLHVCPYFLTEPNDTRKARTLIHEFVHIALKVRDRPYYRPTSNYYAELTPRGSWMSQLPIIGVVLRELLASDTLYHPDAYAHFAVAVSDRPGALDSYLKNEPHLLYTPPAIP